MRIHEKTATLSQPFINIPFSHYSGVLIVATKLMNMTMLIWGMQSFSILCLRNLTAKLARLGFQEGRDDVGGGDDGVGDVVGDGGDDDNVGDDSGGVQCPAEMMVIAVCQEARCHPAVPASQKTVHHNEEEDKDNKDRKVSPTPPSKVCHCLPQNIFSYLCECF